MITYDQIIADINEEKFCKEIDLLFYIFVCYKFCDSARVILQILISNKIEILLLLAKKK